MSVSVNGSNTNPKPYWQSLLPQGSSQSGTAAQSDPLSELLAAIGQGSSAAAAAAAGGAASSGAGVAAASGNSSSPFGPQTLQALFAMQASASNSPSLMSQLDSAAGASDPSSGQQIPQSQDTESQDTQQGRHGHHHHHQMGGTQSPPDMLTSGAGGAGSSSAVNSSSGGANPASNNLIEKLIQMQALLAITPPPQSIATV